MQYTVYLVEDEPSLMEILASYLRREGWHVEAYGDGSEASRQIEQPPHLWILDIMLPGMDGYELLAHIKAANPSMPVIFISARDADIDRVIGLERGGEDYLSKPFLPQELVIRARKLLQRVYGARERSEGQAGRVIIAQPYLLSEMERLVRLENGPVVELSSREFDLIWFFAIHQGMPLDREQILSRVWGEDYFGSDRVVDDMVRRLRRKMPELQIETIYGFGYRMVK